MDARVTRRRFLGTLGLASLSLGGVATLAGCTNKTSSAPPMESSNQPAAQQSGTPSATGATPSTNQATAASNQPAVPQTHNFTVTAVPFLVHEMKGMLQYLNEDFSSNGILNGKEVYGFYPSHLVVYEGDTVNLTLVNPEDDEHTFTIRELEINYIMKGKSLGKISFVASKAGTFSYACEEEEHMPYMWGQLVVLPRSARS